MADANPIQIRNDAPPARSGAGGRIALEFGLPATVLAVFTVVLFVSPLDLRVSGWFYDETSGWRWKDALLPGFIYDKGTLAAIYVAGAAVIVLALGIGIDVLRRWRKVSAYLVLVMVIAPGILINAVLKDQWGRPRPRDVEEFGGKERFERVWEYDGSSPGKSFPSGHASMGFYFFALFFLLRSWGRRWAWGTGVGALLLGLVLGITRIVQGGHFLSDVVWSAGICYFVSAGLFYALRLHRGFYYDRPKRKGSRWRWPALGLVVIGGAAISVSIPWQEEKQVSAAVVEGERLKIKLVIAVGDLRIESGSDEGFSFVSHAEGFGLPGSRVVDSLKDKPSEGEKLRRLEFEQRVKGFFIGCEQPAVVGLPKLGSESVIEVELADGDLAVDLGGALPGQRWQLRVLDGDLSLRVPSELPIKIDHGSRELVDVHMEGTGGLAWDGEKQIWKRGDGDKVLVEVEVEGGALRVYGRRSG